MAQKQYTTYQADILSFELRDALLGILKPGRYIGFDTMTEWQAQVGDNVYCEIEHSGYISKYDETNPTPVLEANRGIIVSTQGTIIADDLTTALQLTVPLINGGASDTRVHLVYMNHAYTTVVGANNATYGIKSGTEGGGIPVLDYPTRQVVIGTIIESIGATAFAHLTYYPSFPGIGDEQLYKQLFQSSALGGIIKGTMPSAGDGIIGSRAFVNNNYLTDYDSITKALSDLDAAIFTRQTNINTLAGTKLDDWATPDDNTDLNATSSYHGLLPKLPSTDPTLKFLRGDGTFQPPDKGFVWLDAASAQLSVSGATLNPSVNQSYSVTAFGVPAGAKEILVRVGMSKRGTVIGGQFGGMYLSKNSLGRDRMACRMTCPANEFTYDFVYWDWTGIVQLNTDNTFYVAYGSSVGSPSVWNQDASGNDTTITIAGYRL